MENAAQALIIAGSIMLAVLLISMLLLVRRKMSQPVEANEERKQQEQIQDFNRRYLVYNQKLLQGSEVLSVLTRAYDHAISLEPITKTDGNLDKTRARKEGAFVNEPLVDVEIKFKDNKFRAEVNYEVAKFDGDTFMGKATDKGVAANFGNKTIGEILGISSEDPDIQNFLKLDHLDSAQEININKVLGSENTINVFEKKTTNDGEIVLITSEINEFMKFGGSTPIIKKRNYKITKNENWMNLTFTTPANDLMKKSFKWKKVDYDQNTGYIKKIYFEEI